MADRFSTRPFVQISLAIGLVAGFGLGGAAFAAPALGLPAGAYWSAVAQAHGHAQLFGFAGLMVFAVALVFLPRLRGSPLRGAVLARPLLALYAAGVIVRVVVQAAAPFLEALGLGRFGLAAGAVIALASLAELGGALGCIALLAATGLAGPPLERRPGLRQVLPLLICAWLGLILSLLTVTWGAFEALAPYFRAALPIVGQAPWLTSPGIDALGVRVAFLGWLVPMSVAFAARNFPLFLWTRPAPGRWLAWGLVALSAGLALDVGATLFGFFAELGLAFEGGALLWLTVVVGALGSKVQPPGRHSDQAEAHLAELTRLPLTESFVWLAVAGALLLAQTALPFVGLPPPPDDIVRHALGAGFVTLLIVGMALRLIPGFAGGRRPVNLRAAAVAIWAAQAAAVFRVAPPLAIWLITSAGLEPGPPRVVPTLLALAGLAGAVSLTSLWWALRPALTSRADT